MLFQGRLGDLESSSSITLTHISTDATAAPLEKRSDDDVWERDPENPRNWSAGVKAIQVLMLCMVNFMGSVATSIVSPAVSFIMQEFAVNRTEAILALALYVVALAFGPVVGGPLSETIGRRWVYIGCVLTGALFTIGAAESPNFASLCAFRFLAGFCWGPPMAVSVGSCIELFSAETRGPVSAIIVLMGFLGPGVGPVIGAFAVNKHGWRWSQYCILILALVSLILTILSKETFNPILRRKLAIRRGHYVLPQPRMSERMREFALVSVFRPVRMLLFEPIVTFICLYVALGFGTLFSFFAAVPYTFGLVYNFGVEKSGLVFLSVAIGCVLGLITMVLCDKLMYQKQVVRLAPSPVPPEHRLYGAMVGSFLLPTGLFWFGWSARQDISWASPAAAIVFFAWGNICIFVSTFQYKADTYTGDVVASAGAANGLARYGFAAAFPIFTIQMYEKLQISWASSLLGFIAIAMMPVPWVLFKFGPRIRAKSQYATIKYNE